jgi:hypothetical protein
MRRLSRPVRRAAHSDMWSLKRAGRNLPEMTTRGNLSPVHTGPSRPEQMPLVAMLTTQAISGTSTLCIGDIDAGPVRVAPDAGSPVRAPPNDLGHRT